MRLHFAWAGASACALVFTAAAAAAEVPQLAIARASGPIELDGSLDDEGWQGALVVDRFFEIDPGDNVEAKVATRARLAYDERFLYVGFEMADPEPGRIRAPLTDRDAGLTSGDYAGILIDSRNDGKTAQEFLANPRGVQYDLVWSDIAGEDFAPDFYWESAARITATGWNLELKIPFSSLRYAGDTPTFGILLFRNYPRDFRYQIASVPVPRGSDCLICNAAKLGGLSGLPRGAHWVAAPYVAGDQTERAEGGPGSDLVEHGVDGNAGLDVKWSPNPSLAVDLTVNPDFSQVESDVGQIATNQRFALFFPEKRTFFLEGADLFSTPIQALYTRTITDPRGGARATGRWGATSFTALALQDRGGGLVVLPGPIFSDVTLQDFESDVFAARLRSDLSKGFLSFLATGREIDGGGSNWVYGPDVEWTPTGADTVKGQWLWSRSETPERPELAAEWDGRELDDTAALVSWSHETGKEYWLVEAREYGDEFRADNGFVPQVGYRSANVDLGYTWHFTGAFSSFRLFVTGERAEPTASGAREDLLRSKGLGFELGGKRDSAIGAWYVDEDVFARTRAFPRKQWRLLFEISPGAAFPHFRIEGTTGDEIDFDNDRPGEGTSLTATATLRAGDHLEIRLDAERSWLDVDDVGRLDATGRRDARLFTSELWRAKATYNFTSRAYLRVIGQWTDDERDPALYTFPVDERTEEFQGSLLLAYKLNWQSVFYIGYNDLEEGFRDPISRRWRTEPTERRIFVKLSYAFQR